MWEDDEEAEHGRTILTADGTDYSFGDPFTLEEFEQMVRSRFLIDYDGNGNLAREEPDGTLRIDLRVDASPSAFNLALARQARYTHVIWFNR